MGWLQRLRQKQRWYKKKRWQLLLLVVALAAYRNYAPDGAVLQDQINSLFDLLPGSSK